MTLTSFPILLLLYAAFVAALTVAEYRADRRAQYLLKPACALGFILIALQSGALETRYGHVILAGLMACAIGDVALLSRTSLKLFLLGMISFAVGHIFYGIAFYDIGWERISDNNYQFKFFLPLFVVIASFLFNAKTLLQEAPHNMVPAIIFYAIIIIAMCMLAVTTQSLLIIIAALMFAISDIFVGRDRFIERKPWHTIAITPLYFGAQALFVLSVAIAL